MLTVIRKHFTTRSRHFLTVFRRQMTRLVETSVSNTMTWKHLERSRNSIIEAEVEAEEEEEGGEGEEEEDITITITITEELMRIRIAGCRKLLFHC